MKVRVPGALFSYTGGAEVEAGGATLGEVLEALERQYPGLRFRLVDERDRIRPHIRFFAGGAALRDLSQPLAADAELFIVLALSGG